jgi:hypothetical protein
MAYAPARGLGTLRGLEVRRPVRAGRGATGSRGGRCFRSRGPSSERPPAAAGSGLGSSKCRLGYHRWRPRRSRFCSSTSACWCSEREGGLRTGRGGSCAICVAGTVDCPTSSARAPTRRVRKKSGGPVFADELATLCPVRYALIRFTRPREYQICRVEVKCTRFTRRARRVRLGRTTRD